MDDLVLSALVVAGCALAAALIFLMVGRRQHARSQALDDYCRLHGYALRADKEPLGKRLVIRADSWSLTARMRSNVNESMSGSSEWNRETVWEDANPVPDRPTFALMAPAPSADWEALPIWAREPMLKALEGEVPGVQDRLECARIAHHAPGPRCLVFESEPLAAEIFVQRLLPLLIGWPTDAVLYISCSPTQARLRLTNCFADSQALVERIIAIGSKLRL